MSSMLTNTMTALQNGGMATEASPYPLAISDIYENIRQAHKSDFWKVLQKRSTFSDMFTDSTTYFSNPTNDLCIVLDFFVLHP